MKKSLFVLFIFLSLFLISCENKNNDDESSVLNTVTEKEWNNVVKDYAFAKNLDTNLVIKVYSSPTDSNDPDFILYKEGLIYKFVTIVSENEFINYGDFENKVAYKYYGLNREHYYKTDYKDSIEDTIKWIIPDFNVSFDKVKFENNEYVSTIPFEGKEKYGHYSFSSGHLTEFKIYFEDELDFKLTIEPQSSNIVLPNVSYIDEMPHEEMKVYLSEALKELKSYGAVGADYTVEAYEHYTVAKFEYLRTKLNDDTYKTIPNIISEVKSILVDNFFGNKIGIISQTESLDEWMWFGKFENGNQNGLVIKFVPGEMKATIVFGIVDYDVLNIMALKEYLENRLVIDPEEDEFYYDGSAMIDTKDCLLIKYETEMSGNFDDVVNYALTCISDNGYQFVESGSSSDYHYEILEFDNKAVMVYFTGGEENHYDVKITFCISFGDEDPSNIINYGVDSPLFE